MTIITQTENPFRTAAFTGHRQLPWGENDADPRRAACAEAIARAVDVLRAEGYDTFLCGLALGADTMFAEEILRRRADGEEVRLIGAIPSERQTRGWSPENTARYRRIYDACAGVYIHRQGREEYRRGDYLRRNEWMTANASALIAVYDGKQHGGTAHTLRSAWARGLRLLMVEPNTGHVAQPPKK